MVTEVSTAQLEAAVVLERAVGLAGESEKVEALIKKFESFAHHVEQQIQEAERVLEEAVTIAHNDETKQNYLALQGKIKKVETQ